MGFQKPPNDYSIIVQKLPESRENLLLSSRNIPNRCATKVYDYSGHVVKRKPKQKIGRLGEAMDRALARHGVPPTKVSAVFGLPQSTFYAYRELDECPDNIQRETIKALFKILKMDLLPFLPSSKRDDIEVIQAAANQSATARTSSVIGGTIPHFTLAKIAASWNTGRSDLQLTADDAEERVNNLTGYPDAETFSVTVEGDSMEPDYPAGCRIQASKAAPPQSGKPHLVFGVEDNKCLLRICDFDPDLEFITLRPLNHRKYQPRRYQWRDSSIRIVRVVVRYEFV
jgi:hypothetical protein